MRFSELMSALREQPGRCECDVPEDWMQGRSAFGGLQSVLAARAMRSLVPAGLPLRTLQTTFVAPVPQGPVTAQAAILRSGKNVVQAEARLVKDGQTLCLVVGVYGAGRASAVQLGLRSPEPPPAVLPPELPFLPGVTPTFTQHFAARWLRGAVPFSGSHDPEAVMDVGFREAGSAGEDHVIAIADYIPPIALSWMRAPAPGSSMTWMLELLRERYDDQGLQNWRVEGRLRAAADGYTSQTVTLWTPDGRPAALSRQSMVVFG